MKVYSTKYMMKYLHNCWIHIQCSVVFNFKTEIYSSVNKESEKVTLCSSEYYTSKLHKDI